MSDITNTQLYTLFMLFIFQTVIDPTPGIIHVLMCTQKSMNEDPATQSTALTKSGLIGKVHLSMLSLTQCSLDGKQQLTIQVKII